MTRHGTVLPIPDDPRIAELQAKWPEYEQRWPSSGYHAPRAWWLAAMETLLRLLIPGPYSSRDYNLTARSLAPFPLAERDWL